jgi:hypothetical protein
VGAHWSFLYRVSGQQTLDKGHHGDFSLPRTWWHSVKNLPSARHNALDKEVVIVVLFTESSLLRVKLSKEFAECLWHSEK